MIFKTSPPSLTNLNTPSNPPVMKLTGTSAFPPSGKVKGTERGKLGLIIDVIWWE